MSFDSHWSETEAGEERVEGGGENWGGCPEGGAWRRVEESLSFTATGEVTGWVWDSYGVVWEGATTMDNALLPWLFFSTETELKEKSDPADIVTRPWSLFLASKREPWILMTSRGTPNWMRDHLCIYRLTSSLSRWHFRLDNSRGTMRWPSFR